MKIVRLGMTEGGLLLMTFVSRHCNPDSLTKQHISKGIIGLMNWLYTTSGYYDKTVAGNKFNFDVTALNQNYFKYIKHLEESVSNCESTQFFFHDGFIMNLFLKHKQQFIEHYNIKNFVLLNGTTFSERIPLIFSRIAGKKVLVISSFAGLIEKQYETENIFKTGIDFPEISVLNTVNFPYCFLNNGPHSNYFETLEHVFNQIKANDFDIALLGCGAYGHMLTHKIHAELGKEAIYVGGTITNLFGILSSRERDAGKVKTNEYWISEIPNEYKPANYKEIENGCYW